VIAVTVDDGRRLDAGRLVVRDGIEKLREQEGVFGKALCLRVVGEQIHEFVLERRHAAGLDADNACSLVQLVVEPRHGLLQRALCVL
jgi:hypothetical protein